MFGTLCVDKNDIKQNLSFQLVETADLEVVLSKLSKTNYSWEELQKRPLPDGVDPSRMERYLNDEDFEVIHSYFLTTFFSTMQNAINLLSITLYSFLFALLGYIGD